MPVFRTCPQGDASVKLERIDAPRYREDEMSVGFFRRTPTPHMLLNDPEWPGKYRGPRYRSRFILPRKRKAQRVFFDRIVP
jgi:hypothetical protein